MPRTVRSRRKTRRAARQRIVIVGGGIGGLAAAILLARRGHRAIVLERDVRPPAATPEEAFRHWERPGVPQFRHSHVFLARLTAVLREKFPEVLSALRTQGALEIPLTVAIPPELELGPRERGDGELVLLGSRRAAFEWALLEVARAEPGVEIHEGVFVDGLVVERGARTSGPPRVTGVRTRKIAAPASDMGSSRIPWHPGQPNGRGAKHERSAPARTMRADLVIDASGRRSRALEWLVAIGAPPPREESVPTGIFYFTRFYRLTGRRPPGASAGLVAGDVGWLKLATFPGDRDTFSITVGASVHDKPFRALAQAEVFEAVIGAFPQIAPWRERGVSTPIDGERTPVLVMGGLSNRRRRFVRGGAPLAEGFFAIGDAAYHSNPIYGRGVTCALLSVSLLDEVLAAHPNDPSKAAVEYARRSRAEIQPYWDSAARGDRLQQTLAAAARSEDGPLSWAWSWASDPSRALSLMLGQAIGLYLERGLMPATQRDGHVYRAVMRVANMLDEPPELLSPALIARVLPYLAQSIFSSQAVRSFPGPTRKQAVAMIEKLIREGATRARRPGRKASTRRPRLAPGTPVVGHA